MKKNTCCVLLAMLSCTLSQTVGHLCSDTNTSTVIYVPAEKSLDELKHQMELLNSKIETLNAGHNAMLSKLTCAENINSLSQYRYPSSCAEATDVKRTIKTHTIQLDLFDKKPFQVSCDETQEGSWTVIQRRQDGSVDFYLDWAAYKNGFGNLDSEFFIGLDKLYALTATQAQELRIEMTDFAGITKYAKYDSFAIGDEKEAYALKVLGTYTGDAGDSLSWLKGQKFTTKDKDNDVLADSNCAQIYQGAWWYRSCHGSNLNGLYLKGDYPKEKYGQGIDWDTWHGHTYSLKYVQMMIRPKRY